MTQPEALRLADELEATHYYEDLHEEAATELRRLHASCEDYAQHKQRQDQRILKLYAQRDALLEALLWIDKRCPVALMDMPFHIHREMAHDAGACARAAIKKAEENT